MNCKVIRQPVTQPALLYSQNAEQSVDCEFNLPDYCQNIGRILKCQLSGRVACADCNSGSVGLEGTALLWILYVSDQGELCSYEMPVHFTKSLEIPGCREDCLATCKPVCDYVNCRAVNERKLDIHGALTLPVQVMELHTVELLTDAQGSGIQLQRRRVCLTQTIGAAQKIVSLNEETEIGQSMPAIKQLLRASSRVICSESKALTEKVMVKGEILTDLFYTAISGETETFQSSLPFNQILDLQGAAEGQNVNATVYLADCAYQVRTGDTGECRSVQQTLRLCITAQTGTNMEVDMVDDAYSTQYDISAKRETLDLAEALPDRTEQFLIKKTLPFDSGETARILHLWCQPQSVTATPAEDGIRLSGTLQCAIISQNDEGVFYYAEKPMDFQHLCPISASLTSQTKVSVQLNVLQTSYAMVSGTELEVRAELHSICGAAVSKNFSVITAIDVEEDRPKTNDKEAPLFIYYGRQGEEIWDIARRYNTSVDDMCQINQISGDRLSCDTTLLIPRI